MGTDRRYLLDTNIVLFNMCDNKCEFMPRVREILEDWNNLFYVSAVSVQEMIMLYRSGRFRKIWASAEDILPSMEHLNYEVLPMRKEHLAAYATLQTAANHNDPFDHVIIAQAIAERMTLISSDTKFKHYAQQRLTLIENER